MMVYVEKYFIEFQENDFPVLLGNVHGLMKV